MSRSSMSMSLLFNIFLLHVRPLGFTGSARAGEAAKTDQSLLANLASRVVLDYWYSFDHFKSFRSLFINSAYKQERVGAMKCRHFDLFWGLTWIEDFDDVED